MEVERMVVLSFSQPPSAKRAGMRSGTVVVRVSVELRPRSRSVSERGGEEDKVDERLRVPVVASRRGERVSESLE